MLSYTQSEFVQFIFDRLGKGKRHAALLYSQWFKIGSIDYADWAEPQAHGLIEEMLKLVDLSLPLIVSEQHDSDTVKFLLRMEDGLETESVLIPMQAGITLCISSQVGCKMGCAFCETGRIGLLRSLTVREIVAQVFVARFVLKSPVRNIVFMGMGEPFDNYNNVMQAIRVLTDPAGLGFGPSRITVSTSGRLDEMDRFSKDADPAVNLAVSINAPTDAIRDKIMPVNRTWNMEALKRGLIEYCKHPRREILIEYVLLKDLNDSLECADQLAVYLEGLKVRVNLIPYNAQRKSRFEPPEEEVQEVFAKRLFEKGYQVLLRRHKGRSIMAACGQLGNKDMRKRKIIRNAV
ncbi:MAG TPA: 23S rRNA (adenine(2503)-C(2))-methyltransferase RlmN [Rhabdochlamydiaceae bacterium]|nr:23S rRNA (adenine(2503)-C(2))-methyltransferase RlmN [Rhabdochlamydiaceae bacterium]